MNVGGITEGPFSQAVAALFSAHGVTFQALSAQASAFHAQFAQALNGAGFTYAVAEATNASPLQGLQQQRAAAAPAFNLDLHTGFWNSGNFDTAVGATGDTGATMSGFGNTGVDVSGFFNAASGGGPTDGFISGFGDRASGSTVNGLISGFFNTGVPSAMNPGVSGEVSGLLNAGNQISGLLGLSNFFK